MLPNSWAALQQSAAARSALLGARDHRVPQAARVASANQHTDQHVAPAAAPGLLQVPPVLLLTVVTV